MKGSEIMKYPKKPKEIEELLEISEEFDILFRKIRNQKDYITADLYMDLPLNEYSQESIDKYKTILKTLENLSDDINDLHKSIENGINTNKK